MEQVNTQYGQMGVDLRGSLKLQGTYEAYRNGLKTRDESCGNYQDYRNGRILLLLQAHRRRCEASYFSLKQQNQENET